MRSDNTVESPTQLGLPNADPDGNVVGIVERHAARLKRPMDCIEVVGYRHSPYKIVQALRMNEKRGRLVERTGRKAGAVVWKLRS